MKKKILFASILLLSCLTVLFGALFILPKSVHAEYAHPAKAAAPTISVSPTTLNSTSSDCTHLGTTNNQSYATCIVTITINGSAPQGVKFTSSYKATACYGNCVPYYNIAILPSAGTTYSGNTLAIIVPDQIVHLAVHADIFISGPANTVKIHFEGGNTCC